MGETMSTEVIDADIHVYEPASMWEYVDRKYRDRIEIRRVVDDPEWQDGIYDTFLDGNPIPRWILGDRQVRFDGLYRSMKEKLKPGSGWDPGQYVEDMKLMAIQRAVVYPTQFLWAPWIPELGADFSAALARAYNDWIYDFCAQDRGCLFPVATVAPHSVEEAIKETKRCADRGFVGVFLRPNPFEGRPIGHPDYDPLYKVLEDLELPLGIHEGGMTYVPILGEDRTKAQWGIHAMSHAFEQMAAMISMLEHKVFSRFPKLITLFLEAGSSLWVPYWLNRLDEEMELTYRVGDNLELTPSEYFQRQCYATFEIGDPYIANSVEIIGNRTLMLTTDYPHLETSYTQTPERMASKGLSDESLARVSRDNALAAYPRLPR